MLRETDYYKIAEDYSTSVGVAKGVVFGEGIKKNIPKSISDDLDLTAIIVSAIHSDKYQQMIRIVRKLERKRIGRIKDVTIYKKAFIEACKEN